MTEIKTLEQWETIAYKLAEGGYTIWQTQYDYYDPKGFHTWFWASGRPELEVVTHDLKVQNAMVNYNG